MEEAHIHPMVAFFNLERNEDESSAYLFMRMMNIVQEILSGIMPSGKELGELQLSLDDVDLKILFQILHEDDDGPSYISPLDAFWNLDKQEDETILQFFIRMFNTYQEISPECRPPSYYLVNKM